MRRHSETPRVGQGVGKCSVQFLCVVDHFVEGILRGVDQVIELLHLALLRFHIDA